MPRMLEHKQTHTTRQLNSTKKHRKIQTHNANTTRQHATVTQDIVQTKYENSHHAQRNKSCQSKPRRIKSILEPEPKSASIQNGSDINMRMTHDLTTPHITKQAKRRESTPSNMQRVLAIQNQEEELDCLQPTILKHSLFNTTL